METPKGYKRVGFRMSDPKSMARFIEYTGIRNFKFFNPNKIEEVYDFFGKSFHSSLRRGWRVNRCGQKLTPIQGNPHGNKEKKQSTWLENFLRRMKNETTAQT